MATKQELLIEANNRGLLTGNSKTAFDEAVNRGLILIEGGQDVSNGDISGIPLDTVRDDVSRGLEPPEEQKGFIERVQEDLTSRRAEFTDIIEGRLEGGQGVAETALQIVGKGIAGPIFDIVGEGLVSAFRALPDAIEQPLRDSATEILESEIGQMGLRRLQEGQESYDAFAEENPRAARNIESVVNTALAFAPIGQGVGAGAAASGRQTFVGKVGEAIKTRGAQQTQQQKTQFLQDLVTPKQTAKVRAEQVGRTTEEGILATKQVTPSAQEARIIDEVAKVPGVESGKTLQGNFNAIQSANRQEAEFLEESLKQNEIIFPRKEFKAELRRATDRLKESPLIVGDAAKSADRIIKKMDQILLKNKSTGSGLLKARKELDAFVKSQKGDKAFDPNLENALSIAVREIRQTTNNFLAKRAKNTPVEESLNKQSALFRAMDNIAPKAADEAGNAIARTIQNIESAIPLKGKLTADLALIGISASAIAAALANPVLIGTAITGALAVKGARSAAAKRVIGEMVKQVDKAIVNSPQIASELRANRAALLELIEEREE